MPNPPRFVRVDPSQRKKQKVEQPQCQTCFNSFGTQQELRDHIADYQASTVGTLSNLSTDRQYSWNSSS